MFVIYLEYDISKCWHRLKTPIKAQFCGVLFASGAITFYEGNNMLSALL
jgi:hypothetical protein